MLKIQEIKELIKAIDQSAIEEFKYETEGTKITLRKEQKGQLQAAPIIAPQIQTPPPPISQVVPVEQKSVEVTVSSKEMQKEENSSLHKITSPMVGTFYAAPSPDSAPYVSVGSKVKKDEVVCIVEAMKLMNEIEAEINGEIVEILVENGQLVEYGQELFLVKPE